MPRQSGHLLGTTNVNKTINNEVIRSRFLSRKTLIDGYQLFFLCDEPEEHVRSRFDVTLMIFLLLFFKVNGVLYFQPSTSALEGRNIANCPDSISQHSA